MPITFKLTKPIDTASNGAVSELTIRDMTARDLVKHKTSFVKAFNNRDGSVHFDVDYELFMSYLADLTGISSIELAMMSAYDMREATGTVARFLNEPEVKN